MHLRINDQVEESKWDHLLTYGLFGSPFQSVGFYHLFNSVDGLSADVFAVEAEGEYGSLAVVTVQKESGMRTLFSRRGIIYGGILISKEREKSVDLLLKYITDFYRNRLIYLEVRNSFDYSGYSLFFTGNNWQYVPWLNFQKDISSKEFSRDNVSGSRMRQIKKALRSGVEWRLAASEEEVRQFYKILNNLYKNKIKKPLFAYSFFKLFFESKLGVFLLVWFKGKVIGGIMCPVMPGKTIYEFYICGLDSEYKEQYPSVIATWAAVEYGLLNNISLFDFMGAGSPDKDYGVREFKVRFGGQLSEHGRFLKVLDPFFYSLGKTGLKILSVFKR